jgi:Protein of unknown function (DUF3570)
VTRRLFARASFAFALVLSLTRARTSRADGGSFSDAEVLGPKPSTRVELVQTRITAYEQKGFGYQSQAGPLSGPGSETLHVLQVQGEFVMHQGDRLTHRVWVPVDLVTSASANAIDSYYAKPDVISTASAQNLASEIQYQLSARADDDSTWIAGAGVHHEENFLSWFYSLEYERTLAEKNATLSIAWNQILDWFDAFTLGGKRAGRASRASSNINVGLSQLLSPSTLVGVSYGVTLQRGELSNTWNTVPKASGGRESEALPNERLRHAASLSLAQWLPWRGALKLRYRFYRDDWAVNAHSVEAELRQSLTDWLIVGASYRYHHQTGVSFFTTSAPPGLKYATADSDLALLFTQALGVNVAVTLPTASYGNLVLSCGYEHYFRSDALRVNVATWATGFHF